MNGCCRHLLFIVIKVHARVVKGRQTSFRVVLCHIWTEDVEKTKDYLETIVNVLLTPRVQLTHKSNVNVENCAGFMKGKKKNITEDIAVESEARLMAIVWFMETILFDFKCQWKTSLSINDCNLDCEKKTDETATAE